MKNYTNLVPRGGYAYVLLKGAGGSGWQPDVEEWQIQFSDGNGGARNLWHYDPQGFSIEFIKHINTGPFPQGLFKISCQSTDIINDGDFGVFYSLPQNPVTPGLSKVFVSSSSSGMVHPKMVCMTAEVVITEYIGNAPDIYHLPTLYTATATHQGGSGQINHFWSLPEGAIIEGNPNENGPVISFYLPKAIHSTKPVVSVNLQVNSDSSCIANATSEPICSLQEIPTNFYSDKEFSPNTVLLKSSTNNNNTPPYSNNYSLNLGDYDSWSGGTSLIVSSPDTTLNNLNSFRDENESSRQHFVNTFSISFDWEDERTFPINWTLKDAANCEISGSSNVSVKKGNPNYPENCPVGYYKDNYGNCVPDETEENYLPCPDGETTDFCFSMKCPDGPETQFVVQDTTTTTGNEKCPPKPATFPLVSNISNCSIKLKIPEKSQDVLTMVLHYTENLISPIYTWEQYSETLFGNEEITLTDLKENTQYYFSLLSYGSELSSFGLLSEGRTLKNLILEKPIIGVITDNIATISNWPIDNCASSFNLYSNGQLAAYNQLNCSSDLIDLVSNTEYEIYFGAVYKDGEIFSDKTLIKTKIKTPEQPIINRNDLFSNRLSVVLPILDSSWKRIDLEIYDQEESDENKKWKVCGVGTFNGDIMLVDEKIEPQTVYYFRYVAYGENSISISGITSVKTPDLNESNESFGPVKQYPISFIKITQNSLFVNVPNVIGEIEEVKINYTDNPNKEKSDWLITNNLMSGESKKIENLLPNKRYWFQLIVKNNTGYYFSKLISVKTSCKEENINLIVGKPPAPFIESLGKHSLKIIAPTDWPQNASYLILEKREKEENLINPENNLWSVVKNRVTAKEEIYVELANHIKYEFRWIAI